MSNRILPDELPKNGLAGAVVILAQRLRQLIKAAVITVDTSDSNLNIERQDGRVSIKTVGLATSAEVQNKIDSLNQVIEENKSLDQNQAEKLVDIEQQIEKNISLSNQNFEQLKEFVGYPDIYQKINKILNEETS
ncbi:MAG: hypothetical protein Q4B81_00255 [Moraxella sp.]|nr:hypothetical protein [Moraxella sp.]